MMQSKDETDRQERYDLHTHTRASDGMNAPADNVRLAREQGLTGLAITDHDTVAGVREAMAEGERQSILVIPGVEISTRASGKDIHVLGYFIQTDDPVLLQRLASLRETREARNVQIIDKLNGLGISITLDEVKAGLGRPLRPDESLGRPHIADALVRKGLAADMRDAFDRYLGEGKPGYASLPRISPEEAMGWIREAGGAPVLAHPGLYGDDELVETIVAKGGPAGIEVYHSDHGPEDEERYLALARRYGLIATGGSDYHGVRQGVVFHGDLGSRYADGECVRQLQNAAEHGGR
ncbi:PHP-like protein [Paenibacillus faecis]|uniref:PHP domain-containing protein n=1 Tax=Paenibacillus faecis TaxID=862114 RepID=UPI001B1D3172|nr:PHP domain-containing protein [Paenibacillus faecis]GIO83760.1 PHP-like protein [Paenibacillus faecis]